MVPPSLHFLVKNEETTVNLAQGDQVRKQDDTVNKDVVSTEAV